MEYISRQNQVILALAKALLAGIAFNIQALIGDKRIGLKLLAGPGNKQRRNIGKDILDLIGRQPGQNVGSRTPGTAPNFQNTQGAIRGQILKQREQGFLDQVVIALQGH